MKTIISGNREFQILGSVKDIPVGFEIWRTNALDGHICFAKFENYNMVQGSPIYAVKCEGSDLIINAAICGAGVTLKSCEKILKRKKSFYQKRVVEKALPYIEKLWN